MGRKQGLRSASPQFKKIWDTLDAERERRGWTPKHVAKKSGFARASYYVYAKNGKIPFAALEQMAACLEAEFSATAQTARSDVHETAEAGTEDSAMIDYIAPLLDVLSEYPEEQRQVVAGVMLGAAVRAVRELPPFDGPAAGQTKAGRGRKK